MTYAVFAPTIGISALLLLIPSLSGISVHFLNKKYGGGGDDE